MTGSEEARLTWYDILHQIRQARPRWDLSTGQPLCDPEVAKIIAAGLAIAATEPGTPARLGCYRDLDGSPDLRAAAAAMLGAALSRPVTDSELLVVPGAQAALRYVQAAMRAAGKRLLFPVGTEFPGAFDGQATRAPAAGQPRWSSAGTVINMQPDTLDWTGVGAAVISQPHSPTGRIWPPGQLQRLLSEAAKRSAWLVIDQTFALPALPLQLEPARPVDGPGVVHIYSFSKVGLASERLGLIAARPGIIDILRHELREHAITASYLGQPLAAALLQETARRGDSQLLGRLYHSRWQTLRGALEPLAGEMGVAVARWQGGPFLWLSWPGGPGDTQVFQAVLSRGVGVTPGTVLHATGEPTRGIRIGLTASPADLEQVGAAVRDGMRAAGSNRNPASR